MRTHNTHNVISYANLMCIGKKFVKLISEDHTVRSTTWNHVSRWNNEAHLELDQIVWGSAVLSPWQDYGNFRKFPRNGCTSSALSHIVTEPSLLVRNYIVIASRTNLYQVVLW